MSLAALFLSTLVLFVTFCGAFATIWGGRKLEQLILKRWPYAHILQIATVVSWILLMLAAIFSCVGWMLSWAKL